MKDDTNEPIMFADVVIEAMPFSDELVIWCNTHSEFKDALKVTNPTRFIPLGQVITSHSPNVPEDEVIGFYSYDYVEEVFKQDFIVNIGGQNSEFVLYTSLPKENRALYGKYVKHIKEFFVKYGGNDNYANTHYVTLAQIEALDKPILTDRARRYIPLGATIKQHGLNPVTQAQLAYALNGIRTSKAAAGK